MKEKLLLSNPISFIMDWVYLFCLLAIGIAIVSYHFCITTKFAFLASSVIYAFSILHVIKFSCYWVCKKTERIKFVLMYIGFYSISFALFHFLSYVLVYQKEGIDCHALGHLVSIIVSFILFFLIEVLLDEHEDRFDSWDGDSSPGFHPHILLIYVFAFVFIIMGFSIEHKKIEYAKLQKEEFIPIERWYKEEYNGNTLYFVVCEKGTFMVPTYEYPEVRDIHEGSLIRVLSYCSNECIHIKNYKMIEIKN